MKRSATITTVSRYMKHVMGGLGVDVQVIPNGISESWLQPHDSEATSQLADLFQGRLAVAKVARWDPEKRWNMATDAVAELKRQGLRPLFLARGGIESHRLEVLARAQGQGLGVASVHWNEPEVESFVEAVRPALLADVVNLQGYLSQPQRRALFQAVDVVLANSRMEPFGLVGLETMAAGGVAFVGSTGEDYITPGYDAISLQTSDPREIVYHASRLYGSPSVSLELRRTARRSAERYTWTSVVRRVLLPFLGHMGVCFSSEQGPSQHAASDDRADILDVSKAWLATANDSGASLEEWAKSKGYNQYAIMDGAGEIPQAAPWEDWEERGQESRSQLDEAEGQRSDIAGGPALAAQPAGDAPTPARVYWNGIDADRRVHRRLRRRRHTRPV